MLIEKWQVIWHIEKETSASRETTYSISYRKLVSLRRRGAYSDKYGSLIK